MALAKLKSPPNKTQSRDSGKEIGRDRKCWSGWKREEVWDSKIYMYEISDNKITHQLLFPINRMSLLGSEHFECAVKVCNWKRILISILSWGVSGSVDWLCMAEWRHSAKCLCCVFRTKAGRICLQHHGFLLLETPEVHLRLLWIHSHCCALRNILRLWPLHSLLWPQVELQPTV